MAGARAPRWRCNAAPNRYVERSSTSFAAVLFVRSRSCSTQCARQNNKRNVEPARTSRTPRGVCCILAVLDGASGLDKPLVTHDREARK